MVCLKCYCDTERKFSPFNIKRESFELTFKEVPSWVCPTCNEVYFDESDVEILHKTVTSLDEQSVKLKDAIVYWPDNTK
ncbi:MAG: YgiT-type zinc finger protein [Ignavibacteriaceae bacterium]